MNLCNEVDKLDEGYVTPQDLGEWISAPDTDKERDIRLWEDSAGTLAAVGWSGVSREGDGDLVDGRLFIRVRPEARGEGLEHEIIEWASARVFDTARERNQRATLRTGLHFSTPEYIAARKALLEEHGFEPVRYFFKMARDLKEPLPEPQLPEGFTLRHARGEEDFEPWVEMFNQSFIDHWNHHPMTVEQHKHWLQSPKYNPERNLIAVAPDGTFAAFCFCWIDPDDNAHRDVSEGWIDILGTRRGFRKIGLGRAMLIAGMRKLKEDGVDLAVLGVDAENPTGALRLYESVGFYKVNTEAAYRKELTSNA
jgi:mycothiol synthase